MFAPSSRSLRYNFAILAAFAISIIGQETRTNSPGAKIYRDKIEPHWFSSNNKFWYRLDLPEKQRQFILVDALEGARAPAFDHERLAKVLSEKRRKNVDANHLPFDSIKYSEDGKWIEMIGEGGASKFERDSYQISEGGVEKSEKSDSTPKNESPRRGRSRSNADAKSPDEKWEVLVRGQNLFLKEIATGKAEPLTYDANPADSYARDAQRERGVGMQYDAREPDPAQPEVYWSGDSRRFVAMRTRAGAQRMVYLIDSSPKDQLQPKLQSYPYLKPGDTIPIRKPHLFDVESRREIMMSDALFENPWSIENLQWDRDSSRFRFLFNQRGHQALRILTVDGSNGAVKPILNEESQTFVDYSGKFFSEYLEDSDEIIWMSERDGWNHLYLFDGKSGQLKNQITKGEWVVRSVEHVDKEKRQMWFWAGGIRAGQDPYYLHYCRINFDGSGLLILTDGDGTHSAQFSPDRRFFIDTWSRVDLAPINELRRMEDGKLACQLEESDAHELVATGWRSPERFVAKGRDGATDIFGIIHWPKDLEKSRKYPVIESIYAGPHDSFVPKGFRSSYGQDKLTKRGFIVVQIDGMGTSNRSKKFHDVCWKNIGDAGFPDRILWIKAAAAKYSSMDLNRVGLYGTSAGGQNALRGLLAHGDFYKAGVADCGCHDNRMDKIWWNEQWMGWPVGAHYDEQSNVTQAHKLQGKLLLMVGELDKNVDPASTMQVVDALIKADKDFELLVMPGAGHGVARTPYGWRRIEEFFVRQFHGSEPAPSSVASLNETNDAQP